MNPGGGFAKTCPTFYLLGPVHVIFLLRRDSKPLLGTVKWIACLNQAKYLLRRGSVDHLSLDRPTQLKMYDIAIMFKITQEPWLPPTLTHL